MKEALKAVIQTLQNLFANKGELKGLNDWDRLIECIIILERIAESIPENTQESEMVNDGR